MLHLKASRQESLQGGSVVVRRFRQDLESIDPRMETTYYNIICTFWSHHSMCSSILNRLQI